MPESKRRSPSQEVDPSIRAAEKRLVSPVRLNRIRDSEARASTIRSIERSNSSVVLKEVGSLLPVAMDAFQGSRSSPQAMLDFLKVIPNVRSLKSTDLIQLFQIIANALDEAASMPNIQAAMN